jgi:hypothetical protein
MWCHKCDKSDQNTVDCRAIIEFKQHKKVHFEAKSGPGKKSLVFLSGEINALKRKLKTEKTASSKKRNAESLLSTEINLTTNSDEVLGNGVLFTSYQLFHSRKTILAKSSQPIINR